jgi:hypothetical protein
MVLTKAELLASLKHEVHILVHLAGKIDPAKLDYRPTPKQRSTFELLKYLTVMGPLMVQSALSGKFETEAWGEASKVAAGRDLQGTIAAIQAQPDTYDKLLGPVADSVFREEISIFGTPSSRGAFLVNLVLGGYAAYRTQLFVYLKACGREELTTMNLWAGVDPPPAP